MVLTGHEIRRSLMKHQTSSDNLAGRYLRQSQLIPNILPFSAATLWRKVRAGDFPQPVRMGRVTAWKADAVIQWLEQQEEARNG